MRAALFWAGCTAAATAALTTPTTATARVPARPSRLAACSADRAALTDVDGDGRDDVVVGRPVPSGTGIGALDVHATCAGDATIPGTQFAGASAAFGSAVAEGYLSDTDDGTVDVAVGDPGAAQGGAVYVLLGGSHGLVPTASRVTGRTSGERFGAALAISGHNVWIAAPNRTVDGVSGAGAVDHWLVSGTNTSYVETITAASAAAHGTVTKNAHFGAVLSVVDRALWIGSPDDTVDGRAGAGSVTALRIGANATVVSGARLTQDTAGVAGAPEAGDHFGAAVVAGVAVGVPGEGFGSSTAAGMVHTFSGTTPVDAINQDVPGVPGAVEAGDQFGASLGALPGGGLVIGCPGEGLGTQAHAGDVYVRTGSSYVVYRQGTGTGGLGGNYETDDRFGQSLSVVGDQGSSLALIGTPGEDIGSVTDAGQVSAMTPVPASTAHSWFAVGGNRSGLRYGTVLPAVGGLRATV